MYYVGLPNSETYSVAGRKKRDLDFPKKNIYSKVWPGLEFHSGRSTAIFHFYDENVYYLARQGTIWQLLCGRVPYIGYFRAIARMVIPQTKIYIHHAMTQI